MPDFMHANRSVPLVDREHHSVRVKKKLTEILFKVFALASESATVRKRLQRVDLGKQPAQPPLSVQCRTIKDVQKRLPDAELRFSSNDDFVTLHFSEIPCSLAKASRNSRMGRPSPRFACSKLRLMVRML